MTELVLLGADLTVPDKNGAKCACPARWASLVGFRSWGLSLVGFRSWGLRVRWVSLVGLHTESHPFEVGFAPLLQSDVMRGAHHDVGPAHSLFVAA